ncbi:MAG: pimeloyl-ACP methyl ester esterase BioH [Methyloprofundus sp.]|nr:pimeloyl-ACP methyl ester esterase BioH [Methyloprofundus sp.]
MSHLHKEIYGQGEPVVMLHGWAMHTGVWRKFAQALAVDQQVICLDLPGHGLSASIQPYTLESIVDAIAAELPEQACTLIGWSLGGSVALRLAEKYSQRIKSLVLVASNPVFVKTATWAGVSAQNLQSFAEQLQENSARTLLRFMSLQIQGTAEARASLKLVKESLQECAVAESEVLLSGLAILQTVDQREVLSQLQLPMLMILGGQDTLIPIQVGEQCKALQPMLQLHKMASAGHIPFITDETELVTRIQAFISGSQA